MCNEPGASRFSFAVQLGRLSLSPVCSIPKSTYVIRHILSSQVRWFCADIRWRYLCDLRRARVPRPTGACTLNPRLLDVFGDDIRDPLLDHPFVRTDSFHSSP